ncbi:MAG: BRO family protein [Nanoarchaeota archaeon]|nr:BRO family protein [Nanoarchaeota archaeon]
MTEENKIILFQGRNVRRVWHNNKWYFSVFDIIQVLTESSDPKQYIKKLRRRDPVLDANWGTICTLLPMKAPDGKVRESNCVDTENAFRLIQSIPSPKAEPFKRWLAKVGYERIQEIENPELAQERMKQLYEQKGYSKEWIEKRLRGIAIRQELTGEWKTRGVDENREYAILTSEISKATFGKTIEEYKKHKGLKRENLRDHMNDLELIFTMLGEKVTTEITKKEVAQGFQECKSASVRGGRVAGNARKETEKEIGVSVVSNENYLAEPEKEKKKRLKLQE